MLVSVCSPTPETLESCGSDLIDLESFCFHYLHVVVGSASPFFVEFEANAFVREAELWER